MIDLLGRRHYWLESTYRSASHLTSPRNLQVGKQWHCGGGGQLQQEEADKVEEGRVENDNQEGGDVEEKKLFPH